LKPLFAPELITGFARLDGNAIGIVANNPMHKGGVLFGDSADKAARFIWMCDAYNVPLVFLEGDPRYYSRLGFDAAAGHGFRKPSLRIPDAGFQVARLDAYELWMTGTLVYADPFWECDVVGLRDPASTLSPSPPPHRSPVPPRDVAAG
jgi:hypothetical protein